MNGEKISRCLDALPDTMLDEAMKPYKPRSLGWHIVRIAACLAIVIGLLLGIPKILSGNTNNSTKNSFLSLTVYAADLSESTTLEKGTILPANYYWYFSNWAPGLPITLSVTDEHHSPEAITFQITVDGGGFYKGKDGDPSIYASVTSPMPEQFTVPNNTTIFWSQFYGAETGNRFWAEGDVAYVDIILFENEKIIGYAILRLDRESETRPSFVLSMIDSVSFPLEESVSEEYVRTRMREVKRQ